MFKDKVVYYLRNKVIRKVMMYFRITKYKLLGMDIGHNTSIGKIYYTWPHKIKIGSNSNIETIVILSMVGYGLQENQLLLAKTIL